MGEMEVEMLDLSSGQNNIAQEEIISKKRKAKPRTFFF